MGVTMAKKSKLFNERADGCWLCVASLMCFGKSGKITLAGGSRDNL